MITFSSVSPEIAHRSCKGAEKEHQMQPVKNLVDLASMRCSHDSHSLKWLYPSIYVDWMGWDDRKSRAPTPKFCSSHLGLQAISCHFLANHLVDRSIQRVRKVEVKFWSLWISFRMFTFTEVIAMSPLFHTYHHILALEFWAGDWNIRSLRAKIHSSIPIQTFCRIWGFAQLMTRWTGVNKNEVSVFR